MGDFVASAIQQQVTIYDTPLEYQADIFRFFQLAQAKGTKLVVLPALSPLMLVPPLASRAKVAQLRKVQDKSGLSGLVDKLLGKEQTEGDQGQVISIKDDLIYLLEQYPGEIYEAYIDLFSAAALRFQMTIVAGSFYLREKEDAACTHVSYVFGPDGMVLGRQEKLHLKHQESEFCQPGQVLQAIETPIGRIGVLIEEDVLYPECGRMLAYKGVEVLINLTASPGQSTYNRVRNAFLSRIDENGLLGIHSCMVGRDLLNPGLQPLLGRSALLQPFPLSAQGNGILAEVKSEQLEGFIAESISIEALKDYWAYTDIPLRRDMNMASVQALADIYRDQRTLDQVYWNPIN